MPEEKEKLSKAQVRTVESPEYFRIHMTVPSDIPMGSDSVRKPCVRTIDPDLQSDASVRTIDPDPDPPKDKKSEKVCPYRIRTLKLNPEFTMERFHARFFITKNWICLLEDSKSFRKKCTAEVKGKCEYPKVLDFKYEPVLEN